MNVRQLRISRRSITIAAALACVVSLAIGAHAALNKRALDAAKAIATEQSDAAGKRVAKLALVIGNGHYPDANAPLAQPINDARALTAALRGNGFDVDVVEDASRDDMNRAIARLKSRIKPDSVVMLFFGGYGVQVGRESYMIPVDAAIWKESDVRRQGVSIEAVLDVMKEQGARAKLVVVDASRRNPYERRFRAYSHGLAPISAPDNALILTSATPGKVADDSEGAHSVLMSELLKTSTRNGRRRDPLQQDPRRHLPRLRRRAGPDRLVVARRRRPPRRRRNQRKRRRLNPYIPACTVVPNRIRSSSLSHKGRGGTGHAGLRSATVSAFAVTLTSPRSCGERSDRLGDAIASSGAIRVRGSHPRRPNVWREPLTPTL